MPDQRPHRRVSPSSAVLLGTLLALSGCGQDGFKMPNFGGGAAQSTEQAASVELVERDVEAPSVFQQTDKGLWDGRPSLGGVWVAHPNVTDPERVIIRNEDNGKFVIGALFRKETATPGPKFQVSSDAAEALGMLAGAPALLNVTALRREEAPAATAQEADTADSAPDTDGAAPTPAPTQVAPAAAPAPAAPAPVQTGNLGSTLEKPFVQIGIFSVEANARRTADSLSSAGLPVRVTQSETAGKTFWRVVAGPAGDTAQRAELLSAIKAKGFADAYFVTD